MNGDLRREEGDVFKGLIAGAIGGLVASWVMDRFQEVWIEIAQKMESSENGSSEQDKQNEEQESQNGEEQEPTTVVTAEAISELVFNHELTEREKEYAGPAVHYAVGISSGAVYGAAAELVPEFTAGAGIPFGTAVWFFVDEMAVPALGLSKPVVEYPASTHLYALVSHFVFGLTTEIVRRPVRRALD